MIRYSIILFLLFVFSMTRSQELEKFKDPSSGKYGIRNSLTKEIKVKAIYENITDFNDSIFITRNETKQTTVYNFKGERLLKNRNSLIQFNKLNYGSCPYDTTANMKLWESPYYDPKGNIMMRGYIINLQGVCIPYNYFPCPEWVETKEDDLPDDLRWIQKGEKYRWNMQIDSAVIACKNAIEINPQNPSLYYWGSRLVTRNYQENINCQDNSAFSGYFNWVKECLDKAEKLEDRTWYRLQILRLKKYFYKNCVPDKNELKKTKQQLKEYKKKCG